MNIFLMDVEAITDREFTKTEFKLLVSEAADDLDIIINCNKVNNTSMKQHIAWQNTVKKFNANAGDVFRSSIQLSTFWDYYTSRNVIPWRTCNEQTEYCNGSSIFKNLSPRNNDFKQELYCINNFQDEYEEKKKELINLEIEQTKYEIDHQRMLFNLKNMKFKLEKELITE